MNPVKALIVEDHPLMANATKYILEQVDRIVVVGTAYSGQQAVEMADEFEPDIVFLDYHLPDDFGSRVAVRLKEKFPYMHIVIFTGIDVSEVYNQLLEIGISGIMSKEASEQTIRNLINCILDNYTMVPLAMYRQMRIGGETPILEVVLTDDEVTIMSMIVKGATHDVIAEQIHASRRSVDNYVRRIYEKFGVKNRVQAIERFVKSKYYSE